MVFVFIMLSRDVVLRCGKLVNQVMVLVAAWLMHPVYLVLTMGLVQQLKMQPQSKALLVIDYVEVKHGATVYLPLMLKAIHFVKAYECPQ